METLLFVLFITFIVFFVIQFIYYVIIFSQFSLKKIQAGNQNNIPVSLIICSKNEYENLKKNLPFFVSQDYSNFELVLIDDASSDNTLELLEEYERKYSFIKVVKVENNEAFWGNKKFALTLGIKASKNEYLLFTDADCQPASKNWISEMTAHFTSKKTIILGYGAYEKVKGSFLNKLIRYETVLTAIQYFSWAKIGRPYMGVGRNLAYKKSEFFNVNGFINHMKIRSGDDDLFINQAANANNTTVNFNPESFTFSEAKKTYKEWFKQKRRHVSTAKYYKSFDKFQLGTYFISQFFFLILAIILLAFQYNWIIVASILGFRYIFNWIIIGYGCSKLKEKDVVWGYPLFELLLMITQINVFIINLFSKPIHWK